MLFAGLNKTRRAAPSGADAMLNSRICIRVQSVWVSAGAALLESAHNGGRPSLVSTNAR